MGGRHPPTVGERRSPQQPIDAAGPLPDATQTLSRSSQFDERLPRTRSAPRVLFWIAILALLLALIAGGIAAVVILTSDSHHSTTPPRHVSPKPPAFAPSINLARLATTPRAIVATPAADGGLWYQAASGDLTRLTAGTGKIGYALRGTPHVIGMALDGPSVVLLTAFHGHAALVVRSRGSGQIESRITLPAAPACASHPGPQCQPVEVAGCSGFRSPLALQRSTQKVALYTL